MTRPGRVVLLNGPSSSGKTSIGHAMLPLLDDPWFFVPVDAISGMRSTVHRRELGADEVQQMLERTRRGYHRTIAALATTGNDVIMDYPLSEPWRLLDLLEVLTGVEVHLVDVTCAPEELARRERQRRDRPIGLAASQQVFEHQERDLVVDTTTALPEQCAEVIVGYLARHPAHPAAPTAFDRLRQCSEQRGDGIRDPGPCGVPPPSVP